MNVPTWSGSRQFDYEGSVKTGTVILYGANRKRIRVNASQYAEMLNQFGGQEVVVGTNHDSHPPSGSLGEWLMMNVTRTACASYVAPILIREGYAVPASDSRKIRFAVLDKPVDGA